MKTKLFFAVSLIGMLLIGAMVSIEANAATAPGQTYDQANTRANGTNKPRKRRKVGKTARGFEKGTKGTGKDVARAGKDTGEVVAEGSEKAAKETADGVKDASKATAKGVEKTGKATASGAKKVGSAFEKAGKKIAHP